MKLGKLPARPNSVKLKFADYKTTIAYLSPEFLTGGKSLEGFNLAQLLTDLSSL